MSVESVMSSNHLILCRPLLLLPSIFPSIWVFSNESAFRIRWPKYWNFSLSISPSSEYSGLILFRMDWFHLLAVQGILKSLLQHHTSKALILLHSALYGLTLTSIHDYWKNHNFDCTGIYRQNDIFAFLIHCLGLSLLLFKAARFFFFFNFMSAVTIHSSFGSSGKENLPLFPLFPHLFAMKW